MLYHGKEKGKNLTLKASKGRGKRSEVEKKSWGRWERLGWAEGKWEAGEVAGPETQTLSHPTGLWTHGRETQKSKKTWVQIAPVYGASFPAWPQERCLGAWHRLPAFVTRSERRRELPRRALFPRSRAGPLAPPPPRPPLSLRQWGWGTRKGDPRSSDGQGVGARDFVSLLLS